MGSSESVGRTVRRWACVQGRVQGVGFRYFTQDAAQRLGLNGYVRNTWEGNVELEAEGLEDKVDALMAAVRKGPSMSFVSGMQMTERDVVGDGGGFRIKH